VRQNPSFTLTDRVEIERIIRENPWGTFVSSASTGLVASHYPVILDDTRDELSIVSHVGRPDEQLHELGEHELLVIFQGPHGYISSSWYDADPAVPTWNFVAVHLWGARAPEPGGEPPGAGEAGRPLRARAAGTAADARHAGGRALCRAHLLRHGRRAADADEDRRQAEDESEPPDHIVDSIMTELGGSSPYASPTLLREMQLVHDRRRAAR
jgi:Transcriptional regulator